MIKCRVLSVASGSGAAPEGLLPRRESLWLGESVELIGAAVVLLKEQG